MKRDWYHSASFTRKPATTASPAAMRIQVLALSCGNLIFFTALFAEEMGQPVPGNDTRRLPFSPQPAGGGAQARERARSAPAQHGVDSAAHGLERILREVAVEAGVCRGGGGARGRPPPVAAA